MTIVAQLRDLVRIIARGFITDRMGIALGAVLAADAIGFGAPHFGTQNTVTAVLITAAALAFVPGLIARLKAAKARKETPR